MAFVLELLEGVFMQAINSMPVESACKNFLECKRLKERTEGEDCDWTEVSFIILLFTLSIKTSQACIAIYYLPEGSTVNYTR